MDAQFYGSREWADVRRRALERDGNRCTISRLVGGACSGSLHGHHLDVDGNPLDLDNVISVCASHHPKIEAVRRAVLHYQRAFTADVTCPHKHPTAEGRRICEERRARRLATAA